MIEDGGHVRPVRDRGFLDAEQDAKLAFAEQPVKGLVALQIRDAPLHETAEDRGVAQPDAARGRPQILRRGRAAAPVGDSQ